jgi:tetratricopeptide (TPR) repeat protein
MGRMHRALMDEERALALQDAALSKEPAFAPALYERAVLRSRQYGLRADALLGSTQASERDPSEGGPIEDGDPTRLKLRVEILSDLDRLHALTPGSARDPAAHGIWAYHQGRHEEAVTLLEKAVAQDPDHEEAWETLANALAKLRHVERVEGVYSKAIARDRGYAPHLAGRCRNRIKREAKHAAAEEDATAAIRLAPRLATAWACRAGSCACSAGKTPSSAARTTRAPWTRRRATSNGCWPSRPRAGRRAGGWPPRAPTGRRHASRAGLPRTPTSTGHWTPPTPGSCARPGRPRSGAPAGALTSPAD